MADARRLLIGVGNRDRGDDAAGPVVCDLVRQRGLGDLAVAVAEGSIVDLAMYWQPTDHVTIVDAAAARGRPGHLTVTDALAHRLAPPRSVSTHAIDVAAAIELARAIDRLPAALVIVGIEGASFDVGAPLSPAVRRAAERVAGELADGDGTAPTPEPPSAEVGRRDPLDRATGALLR